MESYDCYKIKKKDAIIDIYDNKYTNPIASVEIAHLLKIFGYEKSRK